ncbi:hypothetical protein N7454_008171 [Penicillium verhagenii]|nr:hypothetical protein N7454_008171 [Penicillium verhagenii]
MALEEHMAMNPMNRAKLRELIGCALSIGNRGHEGDTQYLKAGVHHQDIYPKNLLVRGKSERLVWSDFDVATIFADSGADDILTNLIALMRSCLVIASFPASKCICTFMLFPLWSESSLD